MQILKFTRQALLSFAEKVEKQKRVGKIDKLAYTAPSCWERRDFQSPNELFIATYLKITEKLFRKTFLVFIKPCQIALSAKIHAKLEKTY